MSDSLRPHRRQPTRLPCPWDSPGKNTGVGCHFPLQYMKVKSESEVAQSCPTLSDPMNCSLPGSSVHGIFQARVLEWGAVAFSDIKPSTYLFYNWQSWSWIFQPPETTRNKFLLFLSHPIHGMTASFCRKKSEHHQYLSIYTTRSARTNKRNILDLVNIIAALAFC